MQTGLPRRSMGAYPSVCFGARSRRRDSPCRDSTTESGVRLSVAIFLRILLPASGTSAIGAPACRPSVASVEVLGVDALASARMFCRAINDSRTKCRRLVDE